MKKIPCKPLLKNIWKSILVEHHKLIQGGLPIRDRHRPFPRGLFDGQRNYFHDRLNIRKQLTALGSLADHAIQRHNGIGGVDHFANLIKIVKKAIRFTQFLRQDALIMGYCLSHCRVKASNSPDKGRYSAIALSRGLHLQSFFAHVTL